MTASRTRTYPTWTTTASGQKVVVGPANTVQVGRVTVLAADGTTTSVQIVSVGREFDRGGQRCRYGYLTAAPANRSSRPASRRSTYHSKKRCITGGNCSSYGTGRSCGAADCDGWE